MDSGLGAGGNGSCILPEGAGCKVAKPGRRGAKDRLMLRRRRYLLANHGPQRMQDHLQCAERAAIVP